MTRAKEKFIRLRLEEKERTYNSHKHHQDKVIEEHMRKGDSCIGFFFKYLWVQTDSDKEWYKEFLERAIKEYESDGYYIKGNYIYWV